MEDEYNYERGIDIEQIQSGMMSWMTFIFEKYKNLNSLLGYLIENDYEGLLVMPKDEWMENIDQHNFSTGWRYEKKDGNLYIVGRENK
jgi:hypothetical protein